LDYTAKNYRPDDKTSVIEGELRVQNGGKVLKNGVEASLAAPITFQADSAAADVAALRTDFNALLAKLKNAGVMNNS
jgi:hypothetical protein